MKLRVNCLIIRMCVDRLLSANRTEFISFFLNIRFHIYLLYLPCLLYTSDAADEL